MSFRCLQHGGVFLTLILIFCSCIPVQEQNLEQSSTSGKHSHDGLKHPPHHHTEEGFRNPPGSPTRSFSWKSLWFFPTRPLVQLLNPEIPQDHVVPPQEALQRFNQLENQNTITWIGHMTAIIRLDGQIIAIDPWFTDYATGLPPFGPHRKIPPGIALENLPPIDTIIISHNHFDHFSIDTLERLPNPEQTTLIVPLRLSQYVEHIPFKKVIELDWHQSTQQGQVLITAVPVVHFSARSLTDRNETLWAGFSLQGQASRKKVFFFEGDYGEIYKQVGKQYGPFDVALIAASPTEPAELMVEAHCQLDQCVQAGLDLRAKVMIPLHWGTMILGSDELYATGKRFRDEALKKGVANDDIWVLKIGETRAF